jgi:hypothetical protein
VLSVIDTHGIELILPVREGRSVRQNRNRFVGVDLGVPFQESDASQMGLFQKPRRIHDGSVQLVGTMAWF